MGNNYEEFINDTVELVKMAEDTRKKAWKQYSLSISIDTALKAVEIALSLQQKREEAYASSRALPI